jgi:CheY-like chemotaxis protein
VPRVLVADPYHETRELLERVVARLGYEIVDAGEPREGLAAAVIDPAAADTLALARELRRDDSRLPIVFATILPSSAALRALRPCAFLQKPFRLAELSEALTSGVSSPAPQA